jgi:Fuc2NAc and GlcNAc transferase
MSLELFTVLVCAATAFSWLLTALVRQFAIRASMLDHPNERSSHTLPTPRGGGVGIVVSFLAIVLGLGAWWQLDRALLLAIVGAGAVVAVLGFVDDRAHMPARWRFIGHAAAAAWVLWWLGPIPPIPVLGRTFELGPFGFALSALFLVWMVNLFNFMDGIDGIASVEAITVAASGALVWWLGNPQAEALIPLLFAACVTGFLLWNFPPAKIFMGDSGSGFLGAMVGLLALWCGRSQAQLFWAWFILIGCFMVDATTTLVRRVARGERFYEAHRCHAYQYAARRLGGHLPVTLLVGAINVFWLLPVACAVALGHLDGLLGVLLAYAPLVWLAFRYKAGDRAGQEV